MFAHLPRRFIDLKSDWASGTLRVVAFLQEDRTRRIIGSGWAPLG